MTAAPANVTQPTGDLRAKGVKFQPNCSHCRESSRSQVWLPLLLLSFVSAYACVASELRTEDLKPCLTGLRNAIEKSDAMLYSPSPNDIQENCKNMSLRCYMLELMMVIDEEDITGKNADCITDFSDMLPKEHLTDCPPCEAYSLKNITIFLERLNNLLEEMTFKRHAT
ncbi:interleukin-15 isoform X1 [Nelusetta ayraudi]|uniref:interleukin-15 isoform X1 n=1 Tax=Nelusetta ayraudi TaxID=303726 RepID=UPI003F70EB44